MNRYRMAVNRSVIKAMASRGLTLMLVFFFFFWLLGFGCAPENIIPVVETGGRGFLMARVGMTVGEVRQLKLGRTGYGTSPVGRYHRWELGSIGEYRIGCTSIKR